MSTSISFYNPFKLFSLVVIHIESAAQIISIFFFTFTHNRIHAFPIFSALSAKMTSAMESFGDKTESLSG